MMFVRTVLLLSLLASIGCGNVFLVRKNGAAVEGIPFYVKHAVCLHQQVYVMPYYRLTLQSLNGEKVVGSESFAVSEQFYNQSQSLRKIISIMRQKPPLSAPDLNAINTSWDDVRNNNADPYRAAEESAFTTEAASNNSAPNIPPTPAIWQKYLIGNSSSPKVFVDYGDPYSLNAKTPFAGSVNASYKLSADGTLTEGSTQVTDETFKTVLSALPISNLISSAAGAGATASSTGQPTLEPTPIQLLVERRAIKITKSQEEPFVAGCPDKAAFSMGGPVGISIEDINTDTQTTSKSDDNSITVSGKISLPKPKTADASPSPDTTKNAGSAASASPPPK